MRLLNTRTLQFRSFHAEDRPKYCILSHTWSGEETTFQEFLRLARFGRRVLHLRNASSSLHPKRSRGVTKVLEFCRFALRYGHEWIWVDTCCIDKESSSELSEAINSMWAWYRGSALCVMYLEDVGPASTTTFEQSRYWTRGWTLQELLAAEHCVFVDCQWRELGSKFLLCDAISAATMIPPYILRSTDSRVIYDESIAYRMSWAASRQTTRPEDVAYCLLGIFDINMTLMYGEGHKAFERLQRKLLKQFHDESIFAWEVHLEQGEDVDCCGLLAPHPRAFKDAGYTWGIKNKIRLPPPITLSTNGIGFQVYNRYLEELHEPWHRAEIVLPLDYHNSSGKMLGIPLVANRGRWYRHTKRSLLPMTRTDEYVIADIVPKNSDSWQTLHVAPSSPMRISSRKLVRTQGALQKLHEGLATGADQVDFLVVRFHRQPCKIGPLLAGLDVEQLISLGHYWKNSFAMNTDTRSLIPTLHLVKVQVSQLYRWSRPWMDHPSDEAKLVTLFPNQIDSSVHQLCMRIYERSTKIGWHIEKLDEIMSLSQGLTSEQEHQESLIKWAENKSMSEIVAEIESLQHFEDLQRNGVSVASSTQNSAT